MISFRTRMVYQQRRWRASGLVTAEVAVAGLQAISPALLQSRSARSPMPLSPGSHLGPYEVLALIGAGGMGEVYRARDPRLGREVAIKVLPHDRVADESRRQRFVQEAKAASALNHPHIVTIYEIESADGIDFLVMEYVRGKSLDALIPRQGMRLGEALRDRDCGRRRGRLRAQAQHRPSRPEAGQRDGRHRRRREGPRLRPREVAGPTTTTRIPTHRTRTADEAITKRGAVDGDAGVHVARAGQGEAVDARSDVFSFGAMLYEMVTGAARVRGQDRRGHAGRGRECLPQAPSRGNAGDF